MIYYSYNLFITLYVSDVKVKHCSPQIYWSSLFVATSRGIITKRIGFIEKWTISTHFWYIYFLLHISLLNRFSIFLHFDKGGTRVAHGWSEYDSYFRTRKAKEGDCFRVVAHSLGSKRLNLILIHTITQLLRTRVFIIKIICTKTHCQALKFLVVGGFFRANGVIFFKLQIEIGQTYF